MSHLGATKATQLPYDLHRAGRSAQSRNLGAYLELTSRRWQSGEMDYSGCISKHGDAMLRSLLYETANSLIVVVRRAHPLKDWARRIKKENDRPL